MDQPPQSNPEPQPLLPQPPFGRRATSLGWVLAGTVLVGLLLVLISWASPVLTPILVAFFLAALAAPFYFWLQKRGVNTALSLVLLIVVLVAVIGSIAALLLISSNVVIDELAQYDYDLAVDNAALQSALASVGITEDTLSTIFTGERLTGLVLPIVKGAAELAADLLFALVLVAFLLAESPRLIGLANTHLADRPFFGNMPEMGHSVITYFGVRTRLNLLTGAGFGLLLLVLGVDHALLWAVLAFVLSYIPYIGLFTAMIPPTILALAEHGIGTAAVVVIGAVVINLTIENVIEPRFTGKVLKLSPVVVLIAFFFWAWLLGPVGAMLSMPIMVMIMLITAQDPATEWIARIISPSYAGDETAVTPPKS